MQRAQNALGPRLVSELNIASGTLREARLYIVDMRDEPSTSELLLLPKDTSISAVQVPALDSCLVGHIRPGIRARPTWVRAGSGPANRREMCCVVQAGSERETSVASNEGRRRCKRSTGFDWCSLGRRVWLTVGIRTWW